MTMSVSAEHSRPWSWSLEGVEVPWGGRPSLYQHILAHLRPGEPGLAPGGDELPDQALVEEGQPIRWAPGALDGVFGHHSGGGEPEVTAHEILEALRAFTRKASTERAAALYDLLAGSIAIEYVDHLLSAVLADERLPRDRVREIARWIAAGAPDREAVKIAIALLGLFRDTEDHGFLLALGRHEELTLYAAVALGNSAEQPARLLWDLARQVNGWGRIQTVERLFRSADPEIAAWLLREGYRNSVLYEYTALTCALAGNLVGALQCPDPDDELLTGAAEILAALLRGRQGPAEGIGEYLAGVDAAELYLGHLRRRPRPGLEHLLAAHAIWQFVHEEDGDVQEDELGWQDRREVIAEHAEAVLARPDWPEIVQSGLRNSDSSIFRQAAEAARVLEIDAWNLVFERLQSGEDVWSYAVQTEDPERIERVVALAEERLPLDEIATGPADELGFGPGFWDHRELDFVLQALRRFPGHGWPLLRAALQSPVISNRDMAASALAAWGRAAWPPDAEFLLRSAFAHEPNEETREVLGKVIAGEPLEDSL
jgi:hypothetical protein